MGPPMATPLDQRRSLALPVKGEVLAGKYRVERTLGRGGTGIVIAAQHVTLRHRVAVKLLLPEAARNHEKIGRASCRERVSTLV